MDRGNESGPDTTHNYDAMNTTPSSGVTASQFPAEQYSSCPEQLLTLTSVLNGGSVDSSLTSEVNSMVANGNTNQTIGFVWGWQALTDGDPLNAGTLPAETQKIVILLSDGLNTQNRWSSSQNSIDTREELACDDAKHDGVTIYSVFVDIGGTQGSSDALQYCAGSTPGQGDSSKYYDLTSASQITVAFTEIGTEITKLRVAQ
jgi:hypothetical protein